MSVHLFITQDPCAGAILDVPRDADWGKIQREFAVQAGKRHPDDAWVGCFRLWEDQKHFGVYYDEELAVPDGMAFMVFRFPETPHDNVVQCRYKLKRDRDVVRMSTCRIVRWVELKGELTDMAADREPFVTYATT